MSGNTERLNAVLAVRYTIEKQLGQGGKGRLSRRAAKVLDFIVGGRRFESCVSVAEMMDAAA